jgi:hypothetical protein
VDEKSSSYGPNFFHIQPYGSTSVLLCEADSDVDICVQILPAAIQNHPKPAEFALLEPEAKSRHFLETIVAPAVSMVFDECLLCLDKKVPVVKGTIKEPNKTRVDLTCNEVGRAKTRYILSLYNADPANFVIFAMLVQWARYAGLIKHLDSDDHVFETAVVYAFIIHLLFADHRAEPDSDDEAVAAMLHKSLAELAAHMAWAVEQAVSKEGETFQVRVGRRIHDFFRYGHSLPRQDLDLAWPADDIPSVNVQQAEVTKFRKACSQSLHAILTTRNMRATIDNAQDCCSTKTVYCKKLSLSLSSAMGQARDFHERELSFRTNATVKISEEEGEDRLVLRAEGSRRALSDLRVELTALANSSRVFTIGMPAKKTSKYFMVGSTFMMVRNSPQFNVKLGFADARGGYQPVHLKHQRSNPVLQFCEPVPTADWISDTALSAFRDKLEKQLMTLPTDRDKFINTLEAGVGVLQDNQAEFGPK